MSMLEVFLIAVAVSLIAIGALLAAAAVIVFFGAMALPEDLNDDLLGDRYDRD